MEPSPQSKRRIITKLRCILADGKKRNLRTLSRRLRLSTAGTSARLRDMRKPEFGGLVVQCKPAQRPGPWDYWLVPGVCRRRPGVMFRG